MDKPYECITSFLYGVEVGDRQELVRCKDCKHRFDGERNSNCCDRLMDKVGWRSEIQVDDDWFCADGKRAE